MASMQRSHSVLPTTHLHRSLAVKVCLWLPVAGAKLSQRLTWRTGLGAGLILLATWHGRLLGAIAIGLGVAVAVYLAQINRLHVSWFSRLPWLDWRRLWRPANRPLTVACLSGGLVAVGAYLVANLWSHISFSWVALEMLLQGMGTLGTLGLAGALLWRWRRDLPPAVSGPTAPASSPAASANPVENLTAPDPVQRLLAIHQMLDWVQSSGTAHDGTHPVALGSLSRGRLRAYFRLMLAHETEPIIRQTLQSALEQLTPPHEQFQPSQPQLTEPLQLPRPRQFPAQQQPIAAKQVTPVLATEPEMPIISRS